MIDVNMCFVSSKWLVSTRINKNGNILCSLHHKIIGNGRRYDTKSIHTTDTILSKVNIDTTNPGPWYQYHHMIYKNGKTIFTLQQKLQYV